MIAAMLVATLADVQLVANFACKFPFCILTLCFRCIFSPRFGNTCRRNEESLDCSFFNTSLSLNFENYLGDSEAAVMSREGNALRPAFRQQFLIINMSGKYFT